MTEENIIKHDDLEQILKPSRKIQKKRNKWSRKLKSKNRF